MLMDRFVWDVLAEVKAALGAECSADTDRCAAVVIRSTWSSVDVGDRHFRAHQSAMICDILKPVAGGVRARMNDVATVAAALRLGYDRYNKGFDEQTEQRLTLRGPMVQVEMEENPLCRPMIMGSGH